MRILILLSVIFSLSAYGQRVKENIKQQSKGGTVEKPTKPVKNIKR